MTRDGSAERPDTVAGSPGAILRRCREFHGISLEEASETTKIGMSHLRALEEDQIREFANQAYLKGFLRIYATYLGLDSDDIARLYDKLFGIKADKQEETTSRPAASASRKRVWLPLLKKLLFPAILFVVIVIIATFFKPGPAPLQRQQAVVQPPQIQQVSVIQVPRSSVTAPRQEVPAAVEKPEKQGREPIEQDEPPTPPKRSAEVPKPFILKIRVTQNGTLTAVIDGAGPQQYDLTTGDIIEWKAEKKISLELSNAGGVDVELNGKPYKALGAPGKPVYAELDADGVRP